jgi:nitrite reductase (NADH) small subunit
VKYVLGRVEEFPEGTRRIVSIDRGSVGVYHLDGSFFAVRNFCPHRGAPMCEGTWGGTMKPSRPGTYELALEGRVLRCPWHGWEYDLESGASVYGINKKRLVTYPVEIANGQVVIEASGL